MAPPDLLRAMSSDRRLQSLPFAGMGTGVIVWVIVLMSTRFAVAVATDRD
jgi:hypothetical protein